MSTWQGDSPPLAVCGLEAIQFPYPDNGGVKEVWEPVVEELWENLQGDIVQGDLRFRFRGEYSWSTGLLDAQVETLLDWRNRRAVVLWWPRSDMTTPVVQCRIADVVPEPGATMLTQTKVTVKVESLALRASIPVPSLHTIGFRRWGIVS
jgi:hypothetical protein